MGDEEIGLLIDVEDLKVFHGAVHHGARVHAYHGVEELIAALYAALDQRPCELAGVVGHIVGGNVDGARVGSAQTHGEAVADVQQCLGNMVAGVAESYAAVGLRLFHQFIVSVLKQAFKVDQMLKIFQMLHLFFKEFLFSGVLPSLP